MGIKNNEIVTDLYAKPCDSKAYLHFTSDHPSHTKKAIPIGLAKRVRRICSSDEGFNRHADDLVGQLTDRGYPRKQTEAVIDRMRGLHRSEMFKRRNDTRKEGVPLVVTYSNCLPNINKILKSKRHILERSEKLGSIFCDRLFVSYRRGTNLGDVLVHRKTKRLARGGDGPSGSCGKNCCICRVMFHGANKIVGPSKSECTFDKTIGCRSTNVIYGIWCCICNMVVYVEETRGTLYERS